MECSHIIDAYTNSKFLYRGVNRYRLTYSCGRCAGCISRQRTDWRVRSYYESLDCLRKPSSFILFDTLTYADDYIPHYSDIFPDMHIPGILDSYCFSRYDVQCFFKRLRISLVRAGYKYTSGQLRYILTSEYGSSEQTRGFKNTHRPHYHILFFVSFPISPVEFSRFVSRCWSYGKTDGVRPFESCDECPLKCYCRGNCLYQSPDYVINERLVNSNTSANLVKCVNYVTKYVSKDMYMTSQLENKAELLFRYLNPDYKDDILVYRRYRHFMSHVLPFHLQSQGFGLSLLSDDGARQMAIDSNSVVIPTGEKDIFRQVALPRYYQRKLFYNYEKVDGRVRWFLNDFGIETKVNQLDDKLARWKSDYRAYDSGISDSTLHDLALYANVYCGTLSDYQSLLLPYKEYYRKMLLPHSSDEQPLYINKATLRDRLTCGRFLSTRYSITSDGEVIYHGKQLHCEFLPYDGYVVVDDRCCVYWHGFDLMLSNYRRYKRDVGIYKDVAAYNRDKHLDYCKQIGLV